MLGYKLMRPSTGTRTWMFCGTTVDEVINTLRSELESDMEEGNDPTDIHLIPFEITQEEIDNMPEFPGW